MNRNLTPAQIAADDQKRARAERLDFHIARVLLFNLGVFLLFGGYAILALEGFAPMPEWAPAHP